MALSGPAAGAIGASFVARSSGFLDAIIIDIGGTSADVSLIRGGAPQMTNDGEIGGFPLAMPIVDIHTIGAGGGSVARVVTGGGIAVGPQSAGAAPGPACYGQGGTLPTVTDANLVLGRLPVRLLDGAMAIDPAAHTTIYAGTDAGVQKTTDGGTTWAAVNSGLTGLDVRALVAHPTLANTLYAGTTVGVFATSNGGTSWSALGTGLSSTDVRALLLDTRSNPAVLWAGSTGGLARLSLGSSSWSDASSGLSFPDVRALALDRSGTIYAGTFGGGVFQRATSSSTWSAMNTGLPVLRVTSLAWDPRGAGTLYAGTQGRGVQTITIPQSACGDGTLQAGEQCDEFVVVQAVLGFTVQDAPRRIGGETRRAHARSAVQGAHANARVIGQGRQFRQAAGVARLGQRVLDEGAVRLIGVGDGELRLGNHFDAGGS